MTNLTRTFAALSDPTRLALVEKLIKRGELPAGTLAGEAAISAPAISRHLKVLREAGVIDQRSQGTHRYYSARPQILAAINGWTMDHRAFWQGSLDRLDTLLALDPSPPSPSQPPPLAGGSHVKDTDTHDIEFIRDYGVSVERLWQALTLPDQLLQWFGPVGLAVEHCEMDFTRTDPWICKMVGRESGRIFKVSGTVTSSRPPADTPGLLGFTWGWHDETDIRGHDSHVTFVVEATTTGARLTLTHRGLPGVTSAQDHIRGWLSTLQSLETFLC